MDLYELERLLIEAGVALQAGKTNDAHTALRAALGKVHLAMVDRAHVGGGPSIGAVNGVAAFAAGGGGDGR